MCNRRATQLLECKVIRPRVPQGALHLSNIYAILCRLRYVSSIRYLLRSERDSNNRRKQALACLQEEIKWSHAMQCEREGWFWCAERQDRMKHLHTAPIHLAGPRYPGMSTECYEFDLWLLLSTSYQTLGYTSSSFFPPSRYSSRNQSSRMDR